MPKQPPWSPITPGKVLRVDQTGRLPDFPKGPPRVIPQIDPRPQHQGGRSVIFGAHQTLNLGTANVKNLINWATPDGPRPLGIHLGWTYTSQNFSATGTSITQPNQIGLIKPPTDVLQTIIDPIAVVEWGVDAARFAAELNIGPGVTFGLYADAVNVKFYNLDAAAAPLNYPDIDISAVVVPGEQVENKSIRRSFRVSVPGPGAVQINVPTWSRAASISRQNTGAGIPAQPMTIQFNQRINGNTPIYMYELAAGETVINDLSVPPSACQMILVVAGAENQFVNVDFDLDL